jgi:hypothetical protein
MNSENVSWGRLSMRSTLISPFPKLTRMCHCRIEHVKPRAPVIKIILKRQSVSRELPAYIMLRETVEY